MPMPESIATAIAAEAEEAMPSLSVTEDLFEPAELEANPHRLSAHGGDLEGLQRTSTTGRSSWVSLKVWSDMRGKVNRSRERLCEANAVNIAFLFFGVNISVATAVLTSWARQSSNQASGLEPSTHRVTHIIPPRPLDGSRIEVLGGDHLQHSNPKKRSKDTPEQVSVWALMVAHIDGTDG